MFCSNCGKTIRLEDNECRHCGAVLGEDRFYGSTYTSSQVRVPVEALNQAPEGGMISYTRTNYMSPEFQPEDDVYSNTTYRPLLSDEEDLDRQEAEEEAAWQAEQAAQEAEQADFAEEEFAEEQPAEEEAEEVSEEAFEEEVPAEDVSAPEEEEEDDDYIPLTEEELDREYPLDPLKKAAISPRVLSYMQEIDRRQQRRTEGNAGLRLPSFLKRKLPPVQEEVYEEELPEAEDIAAAEETAEYESAAEQEAGYAEAETEAQPEAEAEFAEAEYVEDEYAEDEFTEDEYETDETEEIPAEEYVSDEEDDSFDYYEEADYAAEEGGLSKLPFDLSALLSNAKTLIQNRTLQIAAAGVLIVAVIIAGVVWLNFVTAKRAKIADVTYSAYSQGIELLNTRIGDEYRTTMEQVYLTNTGYANETFTQDMAALNELMPEEPMTNDELFVTALTNIQDAIANAIKADANAVLNGTEAEHSATSELTWQAISSAVTQLAEATNPSELSAIVVSLQDIVAPAPTTTPPAAEVIVEEEYITLTNGMMDSVEVKMMQNRLINLGYLEGTADGDFGNGTEAAIKAFQRAAGLTADGIATPAVQKAMFADDAPRTGTALLAATEAPAPESGDTAPQNPVAE